MAPLVLLRAVIRRLARRATLRPRRRARGQPALPRRRFLGVWRSCAALVLSPSTALASVCVVGCRLARQIGLLEEIIEYVVEYAVLGTGTALHCGV